MVEKVNTFMSYVNFSFQILFLLEIEFLKNADFS